MTKSVWEHKPIKWMVGILLALMILGMVFGSGFLAFSGLAEEDEYDLEWETVEVDEDLDDDLIEVQLNISGFDGTEEDLYVEAWLDEDSIDRGLESDYLIESLDATEEGYLNHTFEIQDEDLLEESEIFYLTIEVGDGDGEIDYYELDFRFGDPVLPPVDEAIAGAWDWFTDYWYYVIILVASIIVIGDAITENQGWIQR